VAGIALNFAVTAATILNVSYPATWQQVADGLIVLFDEEVCCVVCRDKLWLQFIIYLKSSLRWRGSMSDRLMF
jgi:hypothetical protein